MMFMPLHFRTNVMQDTDDIDRLLGMLAKHYLLAPVDVDAT
jgi:hypothetical protein